MIFAYMPYEKEKDPALMLVNPETMTAEKMLTIDGDFSMTDVSMIKDAIVIRLYNKVIKVDKSLTHKKESELPAIIKERINRSPSYNDKGNPDIFFGGYDVSADGTKFVYTDEVGLKLYNAADEATSCSRKPYRSREAN